MLSYTPLNTWEIVLNMCSGIDWDTFNIYHHGWYTGLCFRFMLKTIIQGWFNCCWAVFAQRQVLFHLSTYSISEKSWAAEEVVRGHIWESWPQQIKGYLRPYVSCSLCKPGRRRRKGNHSDQWCLSSQVTCTGDRALFSWRWLNICLPMGSGGWISWCFALSCPAFAIIMLCHSACKYLTFLFPFLSPTQQCQWVAGCVELSYFWG